VGVLLTDERAPEDSHTEKSGKKEQGAGASSESKVGLVGYELRRELAYLQPRRIVPLKERPRRLPTGPRRHAKGRRTETLC